MNRTPRHPAIAAAGLALLLAVAACGGDDEPDDTRPRPIASITDLSEAAGSGGTTEVTLDPDFVGVLGDLDVRPGAYGTAELTDTSYVFPITGGNVAIYEKDAALRYVVGQVQHEGSGLTLTGGGTTVTIGNFDVDPTVSVVYGDVVVGRKVVGSSIPVLSLDGRTLTTPRFEERTAVLEGSGVYLTEGAAALLDETFDVDALSGSTKVGVATITAVVPG